MKKLMLVLAGLLVAGAASAQIVLNVPNFFVGKAATMYTVPCNSTSPGAVEPVLQATGQNVITITETQTASQQVDISAITTYQCEGGTCTTPGPNVTWVHSGATWTGTAHNFVAGDIYGFKLTLHTYCTSGATSTFKASAK